MSHFFVSYNSNFVSARAVVVNGDTEGLLRIASSFENNEVPKLIRLTWNETQVSVSKAMGIIGAREIFGTIVTILGAWVLAEAAALSATIVGVILLIIGIWVHFGAGLKNKLEEFISKFRPDISSF